MNKIVTIGAILLFLSYPLFAQLDFESQPFSVAKENALVAEKPFLAYFSGDWCINCKVMEETTFKSEGVAMAVANKYDTYKIDFDNAQSEDWKEEFEICCLPSFLIFDEKAKLLNKIEQPLTSTNLIKLLSNPTAFDSEAVQGSYFVEQQSEEVAVSTSYVENERVVDEISEPKKKELERLRIVITKAGTDFDYSKVSNEETVKESPTDDLAKKVNVAPTATRLIMEEEINKESKTNFQVQLGYFSDYENALKMMSHAKQQYNFPVFFTEELKDGKTYYRVILGKFESYKSAKVVYDKVKKAGRRATIRKVGE